MAGIGFLSINAIKDNLQSMYSNGSPEKMVGSGVGSRFMLSESMSDCVKWSVFKVDAVLISCWGIVDFGFSWECDMMFGGAEGESLQCSEASSNCL